MKISAVINTLNEEKNIRDCLKTLDWVDEIVIVDMNSDDKTVAIAKSLKATLYKHKRVGYVEPARNFALSKASGNWILLIDADERVPKTLVPTLKKIASEDQVTHVQIPRQNLSFGKWIQRTGWWPDYNIRFFKKGAVTWRNEIHSQPQVTGAGLVLEAKPELALTHYNYATLDSYLERMFRYTQFQAQTVLKTKYQFVWTDLITKPLNEFLSRFFASEGYKDGLHGLVLSLLQAFSELIVYLRVWEAQGYRSVDESRFASEFSHLTILQGKAINYWLDTLRLNLTRNPVRKLQLKLKRKLRA